jgi:hypothetical protein
MKKFRFWSFSNMNVKRDYYYYYYYFHHKTYLSSTYIIVHGHHLYKNEGIIKTNHLMLSLLGLQPYSFA